MPRKAPYSDEVREVLRKAGMSENSELTPAEWHAANRAVQVLRDRPTLRRDDIYRLIRPKREGEE